MSFGIRNIIFFVTALLFWSHFSFTQTPFTSEKRTFLILDDAGTNQFAELIFNPQNNAISNSIINPDLGTQVNGIGYRSTDNLLYGINPGNFNLLRIDAIGEVTVLANLNLTQTNFYLAGDVSPDGKYLVIIGSESGIDQELIKIDLESPLFATEALTLGGNTYLSDIAFDPSTGDLFGFDQINHSLVKIDFGNLNMTLLQPIAADRDVFGVYFDAFGTLFGYGNAVGGVTNALYTFNKDNGNLFQITTGAPFPTHDVASCPYAIQINNEAIPVSTFPCLDMTFSYEIANGSNQTVFNTEIEHQLPTGFTFLNVLENDLIGNIDVTAPLNIFRLMDVNIPPGTYDIKISVEIGDIPAGDFNSQVAINQLPNNFGNSIFSNDPNTIIDGDSTEVEIIRIDEDSIEFSHLVCLGEELVIDASIYGNNVVWNNGSTALEQTITDTGIYFFESSSDCQSVLVTYDVTFASCPFTIELGLRIEPNITLPCSELVFTYIIENDSGGTRFDVSLHDGLPDGFVITDLIDNPFGGNWIQDDLNQVFIEGMTLPLGIDSIQFIVEVGDVPPQLFANIGTLGNLPEEIGAIRISDDPSTQLIDSTKIEVLGVETDSFFIEKFICPGETILLDATDFGVDHLWDDGSTEPTKEVSEPGQYNLVVFDGCEPTFVFYLVESAPDLEVFFEEEEIVLKQGDSILLEPIIINFGNNLEIFWQEDFKEMIECDSCPELMVRPFESTDYQITIDNESCRDSTFIHVNVDKTRYIYAPNVFSPNGDGINDIFYLQTPDFGILKELIIYDRWGGQVFKSNDVQLNNPMNSWGVENLNLRPDVYLWRAKIEFIDGSTEHFFGDVALIF